MATVEFDNFAGGEWGRLGADRAAKNQWSGSNVLVYETGEIGVRPGLKQVAVTGLSNGIIQQLFSAYGSVDRVGFVQGTALRTFDGVAGSAVASAGTAFASTPGNNTSFVRSGEDLVYVTVNSAATGPYVVDLSVPTNTLLTGSPPQCDPVAVYGDRLVVGNLGIGLTNAIRFSKALDFNNWTVSAGNAVQIAISTSDDEVQGLWAQRTHLLIQMKFSGFWILTGTPGTNESLRKVVHIAGGPRQSGGSMTPDGRLWFSSVDSPTPHYFDGATISTPAPYLRVDNNPVPGVAGTVPTVRGVVPARFPRSVFFTDYNVTNNAGLLLHNGVWSSHVFGAISSSRRYLAMDLPNALRTDSRGVMILADIADGASAPAFYQWVLNQNSPGIEGGSMQRAGDGAATHVVGTAELPNFTDKEGRELLVRRVTVHFRSWNTGASDNTTLTATVRAVREYEGTTVDSTALTWTAAPATSSASGTLRRVDFSFGDQGQGSAFQVLFTGLRGVAIRRVVVDYETVPHR